MIAPQERNIAENSAVGSQLLPALEFADPDSGDSATLSILDGNDGSAFELVGGVLKVLNSAPLDYEARASFSLVIRATDGAGLYSDAHITVSGACPGRWLLPPPAPGTSLTVRHPSRRSGCNL